MTAPKALLAVLCFALIAALIVAPGTSVLFRTVCVAVVAIFAALAFTWSDRP